MRFPWSKAKASGSVDELIEACNIALDAIAEEWLFQTGQYSRKENPPHDYPPRGVIGSLHDAQEVLAKAIQNAGGELRNGWRRP